MWTILGTGSADTFVYSLASQVECTKPKILEKNMIFFCVC